MEVPAPSCTPSGQADPCHSGSEETSTATALQPHEAALDHADHLFEVAHRRRLRWRVRLRVASLFGLALICATFEAVGPNRYWMASVLLALTAVPIMLPKLVPPRNWVRAQSIFDVGATVGLCGFLPEVWAATLVIVVSSPLASVGSLSRRAYMTIELSGLAGLAVLFAGTGVEGWQVPIGVAIMMVPLAVSYADVSQVQMTEAQRHLDEIASSSSAVLWEIDPRTGAFNSVSGNVVEVFGWTPSTLPDTLPDLIHEDDRSLLWEKILEGQEDRFVLECRCARSGGETSWVRIHAHRTSALGTHVVRGMAIDTTELREAQDRLHRRAATDDLTGLANRSALMTELERLSAAPGEFAVLIIDLDQFKMVNDALGHDAGDRLLAEIASRLSNDLSEAAFVARLAGDEFCVVLPLAGMDAMNPVLDAVLGLCRLPVDLGGIEVSSTASIGAAYSALHGRSAATLLRRADSAMYSAKRSERGFEMFDFKMEESRVARLVISSQVEAALAAGDLRLWFQPKVALGSREVTGAEGLLRWQHPDHGTMNPNQFLDVVELSRHRQALCRQVIDQGAAFVASGRKQGRDLSVSVNITLRDLVDDQLPHLVQVALDRHDVPAASLVLEVTERDLMDDRVGFDRAAGTIRELGVGLSIDDFGTGQSSLMRLHSLPVTELKIDRSFVSSLGDDEQAAIIVRSVIDLAGSLGHEVVAEGIETPTQLAELRAMRCTHGQGFLFSPAVPADEFFDTFQSLRETPA